MGYKKIIPKHPGANSSNMTMVGIGVDDPTTNLDVLGDVRIRDSQGLFFKRHGDDYAWRMRNESSADATTHGFDGSNDLVFALVSNSGVITGSGSPPPSATSHTVYGNSANTLVLKETGNVGIGTTTPSQKFTVYNGNILLDGPSGSDPKIEFHQPTNTGEGGVIVYNDADEVFTIASRMATYGDINFATGMNDGDPTDLLYSKMFIKGNGNVGIGTSTPDYKLSINTASADSAFGIRYNDTARLEMSVDGDANYFKCLSGQRFEFQTSVGTAWKIESAGHLVPGTTDAYDIGSASNVIRNIYTGDLHLSNESKSEGNKVDGTKGNWTMQEGEEHLYIINNKNGKKYKLALEEIQ